MPILALVHLSHSGTAIRIESSAKTVARQQCRKSLAAGSQLAVVAVEHVWQQAQEVAAAAAAAVPAVSAAAAVAAVAVGSAAAAAAVEAQVTIQQLAQWVVMAGTLDMGHWRFESGLLGKALVASSQTVEAHLNETPPEEAPGRNLVTIGRQSKYRSTRLRQSAH